MENMTGTEMMIEFMKANSDTIAEVIWNAIHEKKDTLDSLVESVQNKTGKVGKELQIHVFMICMGLSVANGDEEAVAHWHSRLMELFGTVH